MQPKKGVGRKPRYKLHEDPGSQLWVLASLHTMGDFQISLEDAKKVFSYESSEPTKLQSIVTNGNEALKGRGPRWLSLGARANPEDDDGDVVFRTRGSEALPTLGQWCNQNGTHWSEWEDTLHNYGFWYNPETDTISDEDSGGADLNDHVTSLEAAIDAAESGNTDRMEEMLSADRDGDSGLTADDRLHLESDDWVHAAKKDALYEMCKKLNLPVKGRKPELQDRIIEWMEHNSPYVTE